MKYYTTSPLTADKIPTEGLLDFMDFGTPIYCKEFDFPVWGWIELEKPIESSLAIPLDLIPVT